MFYLNAILFSLNQTCQGLDRFDQNGKILGYDILYRQTADPTEVQLYQRSIFLLSDDHENTNEFNLTISDLTGGVSYDVVIEAYTSVGTGPRSELQMVVTLSGQSDCSDYKFSICPSSLNLNSELCAPILLILVFIVTYKKLLMF